MIAFPDLRNKMLVIGLSVSPAWECFLTTYDTCRVKLFMDWRLYSDLPFSCMHAFVTQACRSMGCVNLG